SNVMAQYYPEEAIIIEQPHDVVECEGSLDQFLFVVAAPSQKQFKIAYRWWKDGRPITNWVEDFGQITFDTLRHRLSGLYRAELFAFDPAWVSQYGNPFHYDSARVSPIVYSDVANLYVLQKPSFMKDIQSVYTKEGEGLSLTFDAQTYGEHNMSNPTYWTKIQWYKGMTPLTDGERYEGTNSSILNIENVMASDFGTDYRVMLLGECDTVWSNEFAISEAPFALVSVDPTNVDGCVGDVVQLSVEAQSTISTINLVYQWWVDGVMVMDEAGKFNGANTPNLNVTLTTDLGYDGTEEFVCQVWPVGYADNGVISGPAMITWKTAPVITMDLSADYSAKEDEKVEMYITATGANLTYTWTKDGVDLANNNDSLVIDMVAMDDAGEYVVTVSNDCGEVTSATATLAVTQGPIITSVNANVGLGLSQNYPNPFNTNSTMTFNSQRGGNATVVMTDMLGNVVANLFNGTVNAGVDTRIDINVNNLNSGTYFITLRMGDKVETRQVSIVR
ncbi:MAG: T9SS type A sorting domain-containing protein, partial [Candidatus Kapaibacterium sp.]